ncbi:hypothetical protein P280DRAFT_8096 [Massarina eburnea CBS 473.64]|uniref:Apple domain-containing protein n=1 Tax=Massarina eburnea CBS 473.64 TaxID=1395130 RepID=A0A6A6SEX6_9PLEO|nr:hypothetical protein P280DRAFT_8096 [Massarina eburnea CBS 473.64]
MVVLGLLAFASSASALVWQHSYSNGSWTSPPHPGPTSPPLTYCPGEPLPRGSGPVPSPDTPDAFLSFPAFSEAATSAPEVSGYTKSFTDLKAANQAQNYLGYTLLDKYDVQSCATACQSKDGCWSFNIYFERSPLVSPNEHCKNPASSTLIKCVFWSAAINAWNAKNDGQYRDDFHVVIAGSNGYNHNYNEKRGWPQIGGYNPTWYGNASINAPHTCQDEDTYLGYKLYNDQQRYDPRRCAVACSSQNHYNQGNPPNDGSEVKICHFVVSYVERKNGVSQGQYCAMYTKAWPAKYAVNTGQWRGPDLITISNSIGFANTTEGSDACLPDY